MINVVEQYAIIGVMAILLLFSIAYLFFGSTAVFVTSVITTCLGYLGAKVERIAAVSASRSDGQRNPFKPNVKIMRINFPGELHKYGKGFPFSRK